MKSENKKKWPVWKKAVITLAIVILCLLLVGFIALQVGYAYVNSHLRTENEEGEGPGIATSEEVKKNDPTLSGDLINILICGVDYNDERSYGKVSAAKTDLIMLLQIDIKAGKATVLQIPRDTYIDDGTLTPDHRINGVYAYGPNKENPIVNLEKLINDSLGLPVDKYVFLDMNGFTSLVDTLCSSLGGLEVTIPYDIWTVDEVSGKKDVLPAGTHFVDGATAEAIIRWRHYDQTQDIKRLETQQYFYASMFRVFKSCPLSDWIKILPVLSYYAYTDFSAQELPALLGTVMKLEPEDITVIRAPGGPIDGGKMYALNPEKLAPILNDYFRPYSDPVPAEDLKLDCPYPFTMGENEAIIRTMGDVAAAAAEAE